MAACKGQAAGVGPNQGGEQIILQPAGKRNVPPAPESGKVGGKKRGFKVFGQFQPQRKAGGAGHIAVARKIKIQNQRVAKHGKQQHGAAVAGNIRKHLITAKGQHIRNGHFFPKAQGEQAQCVYSALALKPARCGQLRHQAACAANGAAGNGAEEKQKQKIIYT